jgi:hypothetical protein
MVLTYAHSLPVELDGRCRFRCSTGWPCAGRGAFTSAWHLADDVYHLCPPVCAWRPCLKFVCMSAVEPGNRAHQRRARVHPRPGVPVY